MKNSIKLEAFELLYQEEKEKQMIGGMPVFIPGSCINFTNEWVELRAVDDMIGAKLEATTNDGQVIRIDKNDFLEGIPNEANQDAIKQTVVNRINNALTYTNGQKRLFKLLKIFRSKKQYNIYKNHLMSQRIGNNFYLMDKDEITKFREFFEAKLVGQSYFIEPEPSPEEEENPKNRITGANVMGRSIVTMKHVAPSEKNKNTGWHEIVMLSIVVIINLVILADYILTIDPFFMPGFNDWDQLISRREVANFFHEYGIYIRAVSALFVMVLRINPKRLFLSLFIYVLVFIPFVFIGQLSAYFDLSSEVEAGMYIAIWLLGLFI